MGRSVYLAISHGPYANCAAMSGEKCNRLSAFLLNPVIGYKKNYRPKKTAGSHRTTWGKMVRTIKPIICRMTKGMIPR